MQCLLPEVFWYYKLWVSRIVGLQLALPVQEISSDVKLCQVSHVQLCFIILNEFHQVDVQGVS